jgi:ribonuclease-3
MALKRPTGEELARIVCDRTGYAFGNLVLLQTALTHSSTAAATNNERLEFLGDRVLALVVSELLFSSFPQAREGELAVRLNALVRADTCADVAREVGLDGLIRADSAVRAGGSAKAKNVLSDATEALIAAIYIDGGMDAARGFILRYWEKRSQATAEVPRDAKTELQEWAAQRSGARPAYAVEKREGPDHAPTFTVAVEVPGFERVLASGGSKQAAERAAAEAFLAREGIRARENAS